ncbi:MAG TPA: SURF1 family protein [Longimicrobiaceae bacterium]|nr:SURF1 family protein [Longimicrobiaceae bacterium]
MRPKSWIAALVLVVVVAAVCIRLGFWQLHRLDQRRTYNAAVAAAMELPPVRLDSTTLATLRADPAAYLHRRAVAEGDFVPGSEIVLRGRAHGGQPGVHLVAPLRLAGGQVVLVNRGWIYSADAATIDPRRFRSSGMSRVEGLLQEMPPADADPVAVSIDLGDTTIVSHRRLAAPVIEPDPGRVVAELYLQELPRPSPAAGGPLPVPHRASTVARISGMPCSGSPSPRSRSSASS